MHLTLAFESTASERPRTVKRSGGAESGQKADCACAPR